MVVYATVLDQLGNPITNENSLLAAFSGTTLLGVVAPSPGPNNSIIFQLTVASDIAEQDLSYQIYNAENDEILIIGPGPSFISGSTVGSIVKPEPLKGKFPPAPAPAMNRELSLLEQIRDQELLNNYLRLSAALDEKGKRKLLAEQTAWLKLREKKSRDASSVYEGGTMAPAAYGKMYLQMTIERNKILTSRMTSGTRSLSSNRK
jgi:Lysozyme inhibitor LprI